jgi:hemerythrin-like domain-containing protein
MKATELLQKQHRDLEELLERLHAGTPGDVHDIRRQLAATLVAHAIIEHEHFYPAVQESLPDEVFEAIEEHGLADVELARLLAGKPGDSAYEAKASVLSEIVVRHIRREESDIFKTADRELGDERQARLAEMMALRFHQIVDTGFEKHLRKALEEEVPRTPARRAAAKKTARRVPAAQKAKTTRRRPQAQARPKRITGRRTKAERATAKPAEHTGRRKATQKPERAKRGKRPARRRTAGSQARARS